MPTESSAPYAAPEGVEIGDYVNRSMAPNFRYSEEEHADHAYTDSPVGAWAPSVGGYSTESTPDARRNNVIPLYQFYPRPGRPPEDFYQGSGRRGLDNLHRHNSVETVDGDGWREFRGDMTRKRAAPDIRRTPPPESRKTSDMAPTSYSYTRPFDQTMARRLNGQHFSMADHRRSYEVYGMAPVYSRRNTYRADPLPWDTDIVDSVPNYTPTYARIQQTDVPDAAGRSWRLM